MKLFLWENPYLIKSSQKDPLDSEGLLVNRDATSVQQLSEWGMKMVQSKFPCVCYDDITLIIKKMERRRSSLS